MGGTGVIDNFLGIFTRYIDSGFGLVQGDVRWMAGVLIAIDITLAGVFWALAPDEDVIARLIKKTLYIGVFAFIIGNFNNLAQLIYNSFAGLGIEAGGGTLSQAQLLQPGRLAQVGITAGQPILISISGLMGFTSFFDNFIQIAILLIAWLILVISFFIMAIQLFVSLIEFKLTTLAGFVLVPFGLFGRTAFLAEKVLGNVVSSGVKVLVLAVIVGIGSTIFGQFTSGFNDPPTISDALTLTRAGYLNAIQVYPFSDGALYQIYSAPGEITDIALEPGEQLVGTGPVAAGDTVRWIIGDTESGTGPTKRVHILVKPTRADLTTNLVINTDRRTYHLELRSAEKTYMASVSWAYPQDQLIALRQRNAAAQVAAPIATGIDIGALNFRYNIEGDDPAWRPLRAFDDGRQVFIEFPAGIGQGEMPPLWVIGAEGDGQLVNFRVQSNHMIVDRLFGAAELRLGGENQKVVRIVRTDGRPQS
jgi:P-type conjugative transfer protein TrbG/P-type conjugative transfer protein TrbL